MSHRKKCNWTVTTFSLLKYNLNQSEGSLKFGKLGYNPTLICALYIILKSVICITTVAASTISESSVHKLHTHKCL